LALENYDPHSVYGIVAGLQSPPEDANDNKSREIRILKDIMSDAANANYWSSVYVSNPSWLMSGYNKGTVAATFTNSAGNVTVAFRGTQDGEWLDNAIAYAGSDSKQQAEALRYFNEVIESYGADYFDGHSLTVTGHSKGGNKAQYVTLVSEHGEKIDRCYSFDGQGFSPEAIYSMKLRPNYLSQLEKMYSICGENDYVNVLGCEQVFLDGHVFYAETKNAVGFSDFHEIAFLFEGRKMANTEGVGQGSLARYVSVLSDVIAKLPPVKRAESSRSIMQILEVAFGGRRTGYEGEAAGSREFFGLITHGLPAVIRTGIGTEEGRALISEKLSNKLNETYEKDGAWGVAGLLCATGLVLPYVTPILVKLTGDVFIVSSIVDGFNHFCDAAVSIWKQATDTAARMAKGAFTVASDYTVMLAQEAAEDARLVIQTIKQLQETIVTGAASVVHWTQKRLVEMGEETARFYIEGGKKILIAAHELSETVRSVDYLEPVRKEVNRRIRLAKTLVQSVQRAYLEPEVNRRCQIAIQQADRALDQVDATNNIFLGIGKSMVRAMARLMVEDELQASRISP